MKTLKTALSVILVFCMVMSLGGAAFADGEESETPAAEAPAGNTASESAISSTVSITANSIGATVSSGESTVDSSNTSATIDGVPVTYTPGTGTIGIGGPISTGINQDGVTISNSGSKITVSVGTEESPAGITADFRGLEITQSVSGSTTAVTAGDINAGTQGILFDNENEGDFTIDVQDVNSKYDCIWASDNKGSITLRTGDLTAESGKGGIGLLADKNTGGFEFSVGDVEAANIGICLSDNSGTITGSAGDIESQDSGLLAEDNSGIIKVQAGSITTDGYGIFASSSDPNSSAVITASGDVKGGENCAGIEVKSSGKETTITVGSVDGDGKVTGGTVTGGINLGDNVEKENTTVTVWKADKIKGDESVIKKVINYLVCLVKPSEDEGTLSFETQNGKTVDGMAVAQEDETITLSVSAKDGYEVDQVYYNDNTVITPDDNGNFIMKVLRGGGINLSAIFKPKQPEPEPQPDPKPDPKPVSAPAVDLSINAVKCTFDLDGGSLKGETGKVIKWYIPGSTVKLPAAPSKDGFTFAGWETKVNGEKKVFEAGEKFTVTGAQSFTALWEEA